MTVTTVPTTTVPTTATAYAVLDAGGEIVVLLEGGDAPAAATQWADDGYSVVAVDLDLD